MPNSTTQAWTRDEVERLISWMEDNQEKLRGKQVAWHKEVKEQVFGAEEHITMKRIPEKNEQYGEDLEGRKSNASTTRVGS